MEMTQKQKATETVLRTLEDIKIQINDAMVQAEQAAQPEELPAELLVSMLRFTEKIDLMIYRTKQLVPVENPNPKTLRTWRLRAEAIVSRI